ncbi:hypothetical protein KM043_004963 [Ampulex compressa]|nr:hypothetical protein KM043_004963 [Ampulex compressa]
MEEEEWRGERSREAGTERKRRRWVQRERVEEGSEGENGTNDLSTFRINDRNSHPGFHPANESLPYPLPGEQPRSCPEQLPSSPQAAPEQPPSSPQAAPKQPPCRLTDVGSFSQRERTKDDDGGVREGEEVGRKGKFLVRVQTHWRLLSCYRHVFRGTEGTWRGEEWEGRRVTTREEGTDGRRSNQVRTTSERDRSSSIVRWTSVKRTRRSDDFHPRGPLYPIPTVESRRRASPRKATGTRANVVDASKAESTRRVLAELETEDSPGTRVRIRASFVYLALASSTVVSPRIQPFEAGFRPWRDTDCGHSYGAACNMHGAESARTIPLEGPSATESEGGAAAVPAERGRVGLERGTVDRAVD